MNNGFDITAQINRLAQGYGWKVERVFLKLGEGKFSTVLLSRKNQRPIDKAYTTVYFSNGAFFWGHYDMDFKTAISDFYERANKA
jgi:hypothetical protein